ncbi:acyltransferase, partial [Synechococcus lacustris]|uniref:acyltransferase family protein n=1 Tax=Synechococcus lacustris TaxID=2116544 RepID=UPI0020CC48BE
MRGIAVLAVFIYHLNEAWLPGGFTGVDVFFVISGYVVTGSLLGHQGEGPWQQLAGFYVRRIRRLLPNLLASVGVTSLGIALLVPPSETRSLFGDAVKALYGWSNNRFAAKATDYFGLDSNLNPLSHTWSLGVEEQFYLIFPLLLLLIGVGRRRALPILLGLSLASLGLSLWWTQEAPILAFFLMPSRFWELSAGAVLLLAQLRGFGVHLNRLWLRLGGYGLMLLALLKTSSLQWFPAPGALVAVLATLLLLQAGYGATSERFLPWRGLERFLVACGLISYSLYLWHWPVLTFLRWTYGIDRFWLYSLAIGLSFGLAWLAYVLVEQPVRRRPLSAPFQWGLALIAIITTWIGIDTLGYQYKGKIFLGSS